jgi:cation transport ATPase
MAAFIPSRRDPEVNEVALAKVLTNITVLVAAVLAIGIEVPVATRMEPVAYTVMMVILAGLAGGYAAFVVRKLPPDGRRHLARMLRRRQWLLTVAAIMAVVVGLAGVAALFLTLSRAGTLPPALVVLVVVLLSRLLVTAIIRRARRRIH